MKAVIGIKMPPKVLLLGIKKNIVFCMGKIKSSLFMFLFLGISGGERVKPLQGKLIAHKPYLFPIFAGSYECLKSQIFLSAKAQIVQTFLLRHRRPAWTEEINPDLEPPM